MPWRPLRPWAQRSSAYIRRPKSSPTEAGPYFTEAALLSPPLTRPAYSDRMAYVLAEMSDLGYYQFEGQRGFVDDAVENAMSLDLTDDTNVREFLEKFSTELMSGRRLQLGSMKKVLSNSGFSLLDVIDINETQGFACKRLAEAEPPYLVLAFRGTEKKISDWLTDARCVRVLKTPVYRIVNSSDTVPRVPPGAGMMGLVLLVQGISWLTRFAPPVSVVFDKLDEFLDKLNGYRHFAELRHLSDVAEGRLDTVRLLSNPPAIDRVIWMWKRVAKSFFVPVGPAAVPDCGPPAGDAALDLCTAPALEPLRPILAVRLDEGVGDGMDEVGVRRHVVLPCRKAAPCRLDGSPPNPCEAPSALASTPDGCTSGVRCTLRDEGRSGATSGRARAARAAQTSPRRQHAPAQGARSPVRWPGNDGRVGNGSAG